MATKKDDKKKPDLPGDTCPWEKNLKLWNDVCTTDPNLTKKVTIGTYSYTTIDAQSQIKEATKQWGPMGRDWGVVDENFHVHSPSCHYTAILFHPGSEASYSRIPIHSDIEIVFSDGKRKGKYNDDWSKKVATDALTKGLSKLGFNSDIFEGKFDDNKYVQERLRETANGKADKPATDAPPSQGSDAQQAAKDIAVFQKGCEGCADLPALEKYKKACTEYVKSKSPNVKKSCTEIYKKFKKVLSQPMANGAKEEPVVNKAESLKLFNHIILCITEAEDADQLMAVMNKYYEPDKDKLIKTHQTVIEKTQAAQLVELGGK